MLYSKIFPQIGIENVEYLTALLGNTGNFNAF